MEKKLLKDKLKKIKATLLSGAVLASATGCAEAEQDEIDEKNTKPSIVSEIETEEPTNKEITTSTTKEKQKKTTTEPIEEPTDEIDDEKTTSENTTTQITTEPPIQTTAKQEPTEHHQETTKKTTTKKTTTQTTTEPPIQTPTEPTEIPYEQRTYTKEDITSSDEYVSYYAFMQLCDGFHKDLFSNYIHQTQYGKYISSVSPIILGILNYNQGLNPIMLSNGSMYGDYTEKEFIELCDNLNLADYQVFYNTNVDFRKYVLDQNFAEFLNRVCAEYKEYINGNTQPLEDELERYFNSTPNNYVEYYFMANTRAMMNNYSGNYFETLDPEAQKLYYDNVCRPFYNSFMQYSEKNHTK